MRRWLILFAVWLLGAVGLWSLLPPAPRASFVTPLRVVCVAESGVVVTVRRWNEPPEQPTDFRLEGPGPLEGWDVVTGRRLWAAHGPEVIVGAAPIEDGRRLLVHLGPRGSSIPEAVELREAATAAKVCRFPVWTDFSPPDGRFAVVPRTKSTGPLSGLCETDLYETATGRWVRRFPDQLVPDFSPNGLRVLVRHPIEAGGEVYDSDSGRLLTRFTYPRYTRWAGDDRTLLDADGIVWDIDAHAARRRLPDYPDDAEPSRDGRWMLRSDMLQKDENPDEVVWRLTDGGDRRVGLPAGFSLSRQEPEQGGRLLAVSLRRERPAGAAGRWLSNRHPRLGRLGRTEIDRPIWLIDPQTAATVAELPADVDFLRLSADGRTLYSRSKLFDGTSTERVDAWDVPPRPSIRLAIAVAASWTVVVAAISRWQRRLVRR